MWFFNEKDCISLLVHKAHEDGLIWHFRVAKTLDVLYEHFY
jgi:hypothetical protein